MDWITGKQFFPAPIELYYLHQKIQQKWLNFTTSHYIKIHYIDMNILSQVTLYSRLTLCSVEN